MNGWFGSCRRTWGPLLAARRAGAISEPESRRLDRHLETCARCRALAEDVDAVRDALVKGAREQPLDHPEPEALAALATSAAGLGTDERARLERHLDACPSCRSEWNAARAFAPPAVIPRRATARVQPWNWFLAGAAAAAVVIGGVVFWPSATPPVPSELRASAGPVQVRGSHHRAGGEPTVVDVRGRDDVIVSLTVEVAPGSALRIELRRSDGSIVSSSRFVTSDPSGLVFVSVPASIVPRAGGAFRVTVEATGETFDYPFRASVESD